MYTIIAPSASPRDLVSAVTSTSVNISWNDIDCIERNGPITGYIARLRLIDGSAISGGTYEGQSYSANVSPFTDHIFQVAGINADGTGPFSSPDFVIRTDEGGTCY